MEKRLIFINCLAVEKHSVLRVNRLTWHYMIFE